MQSSRWTFVALSVAVLYAIDGGRDAGAAVVSVSPDPAPLEARITISGSGFPTPGFPYPGTVIFRWDDNATPLESAVYGIDASGGFSLVLGALTDPAYPQYDVYDTLAYLAWPLEAGEHTLHWEYTGFGVGIGETTFTLTPRSGWPESPALPGTPRNELAPGVLAFVYDAPDGATNLVVTDGSNTRIWASTTAASSWPHLCQLECTAIRHLRWSPDGTRLAFTAVLETAPNHNVYVLDRRTNRLQQLTPYGGRPPVVAAGSGVGAISGRVTAEACGGPAGASGIHVSVVGTGIATSVPATARGTYDFTLSDVPAGTYSVNAWYGTMGLCVPNGNLPVTVRAGQTTPIGTITALGGFAEARAPTWVDGDTLVYTLTSVAFPQPLNPVDVNELFTVTPGTAPVRLSDETRDGPAGGTDAAPGSGHLVVQRFNAGLWAVDVDDLANTFQPVTSPRAIYAATFATIADGYPVLASDGAWVAFTRSTFSSGTPTDPTRSNLMIKDVARGTERQLTHYDQPGQGKVLGDPEFDDRGGRPAWSPDRSQVAYTFTDNDQTTRIRVANVAGPPTIELVTEGSARHPSWTDGEVANFPDEPVPFEATSSEGGTSTTTVTTITATTTITGGSSTTIAPCRTARCRVDTALHGPTCSSEFVPAKVLKQLERALGSLDNATVSTPKRARKLVRKARKLLKLAGKAAGRAATSRRPKLSTACAAAIIGATETVRDELGSS